VAQLVERQLPKLQAKLDTARFHSIAVVTAVIPNSSFVNSIQINGCKGSVGRLGSGCTLVGQALSNSRYGAALASRAR